MQNFNPDQLKHRFDEIHTLIDEAIKNGFVTDKAYEQIKTEIAKFDELILKNAPVVGKSPELLVLKNKMDVVYEILSKIFTSKGTQANPGDHKIIGDYFSDDNSFTLSEENKSALINVFSS